MMKKLVWCKSLSSLAQMKSSRKWLLKSPDAENGFSLFLFVFEWRHREEYGGNWYYSKDLDMEGWLCPALFKYFDNAPEKIYTQFKPVTT